MMKTIYIAILLMIINSFNTNANPNNGEKNTQDITEQLFIKWEQLLEKNDCNTNYLFDAYKLNKQFINKNSKGKDEELIQRYYKINDYCFTYSIGKYFFYNNEETYCKEKKILKNLPRINLNDTSINTILNRVQFANIVDYYYYLKFLKEGVKFNNAKGGFYGNTSMITTSDEYNYKKWKSIFNLKNERIKEYYLNQLKKVFRYNGYTNLLSKLRPIIENNCNNSKLKKEICDLYNKYYHLQKGMPAPEFKLTSHRNKQVSLSDYKGKVVVIDVWATWCCWCIKKLPKFLELKEIYKDRKDIVFLTISINKFGERLKWKYSLPKYNLMGITNLIAYADKTNFSENYNITGVPRYFVIDQTGDIVNVYCPSPDKNLKAIIDKTLAK